MVPRLPTSHLGRLRGLGIPLDLDILVIYVCTGLVGLDEVLVDYMISVEFAFVVVDFAGELALV